MNACRLLLHLCFVGSRQRGWRRSAECGLEVQGLAMTCQGCPGWHPPSTLYLLDGAAVRQLCGALG